MRVSLFLYMMFMLLVPFHGELVAQVTKLQTGKEYFMDADYFKALEYFNQAITTDRNMTAEMFTEAYYYRSLTYIRLHNQSFTTEDKELQKRFADALLLAYEDLKSSLGYDDGRSCHAGHERLPAWPQSDS